MAQKSVVQVIPPPPMATGVTYSQGTRVVLDDGSELEGVYRVVLTAEVNETWSGVIHVRPKVGIMKGMLVTVQEGRSSWWRTLLCGLAGAQVQVTGVGDDSHTWRKP